jgi:branched-chain amino acid transport system permease protein
VIIIIGVALCLGLWWFQEKTKVGAIIRAGMDDTETVLGLGINLTPINIGAFCLGAFLAGFAGVIGAPIIGGLNLESGTNIFLLALGVVIVGGVGSVLGSLVGALLIGITTILVGTYFPIMAMFVVYILMIIVLIFKPSGLLGRK